MKTIRIRTKVESDTLHLPELRDLIGKSVEIIVREEAPAVRDQFYAELARVPDTEEAFDAQQATYRQWRADPRFEAYWPTLDHLLARDFASARRQAERWAAAEQAVRELREEGSYDFDAWREQREFDKRHAGDHLP